MSRTDKDSPKFRKEERWKRAERRKKDKLSAPCQAETACWFGTSRVNRRAGALNEHYDIVRGPIEREVIADQLDEGADPRDIEDRSCVDGAEHCTDWPKYECCICGADNSQAPWTSESR